MSVRFFLVRCLWAERNTEKVEKARTLEYDLAAVDKLMYEKSRGPMI